MSNPQTDHLIAGLKKLERITAENRAYLFTPAEAAAVLDYIRKHGIGGGFGRKRPVVRAQTPETPARPQHWGYIKQFLNELHERNVDMDGPEPAEQLYDYFSGDMTKHQAARAVQYWRQQREATPA